MKIKANQEMFCMSRTVYKDEIIDMPEEYARVLVLTKRAEQVKDQHPREPTPEPQPPPPPPPKQVEPMTTDNAEALTKQSGRKKRYMRRDMRAED